MPRGGRAFAGSENRASPSRDAERRRPEEGPGGACAGPGGAGRARWVWCGGSPGPGGRPLLGFPRKARGLGDAGSTGCPAGGKSHRAGALGAPFPRPGRLGASPTGGVSRDPWDPRGWAAGGPDGRTAGAARRAAAVGREKLARGAVLRNCRTLRRAQSAARPSPGQRRHISPRPGPAGPARRVRAQLSARPGRAGPGSAGRCRRRFGSWVLPSRPPQTDRGQTAACPCFPRLFKFKGGTACPKSQCQTSF